jgi:hypothetical protein
MRKGKLRVIEGGRVGFFCPGCNEFHVIPIEGPNAWGFNGDYDKPTFTPSILVYPSWKTPPEWDYDSAPRDADGKLSLGPDGRLLGAVMSDRCHSFVRDGKIQFLSDCTHKYAGQTLDLEEDIDE